METIIDLSNKHILIAGASSGIGRETAVKLSRVGAKLTMIARNEKSLAETLSMLEGDGHEFFVIDVSDLNSLEVRLRSVIEKRGALDGFLYTVGLGPNRPVKVSKPDYMENVIKTNFLGFFECCRIITQRGRYNPGMHIVGISSCASVMGGKGQSAYSASKAAMDAAVRIMAQEFADKQICINSIRPGMTDTDTYRSVIGTVSDRETEELNAQQFLGLGKPEEVANVIAFLLSPASGFITGANIAVDGGYTCH